MSAQDVTRLRIASRTSVLMLRIALIAVGMAVLATVVWLGTRSCAEDAEFLAPHQANLRAAGKTAGLVAAMLLMLQFALSARMKPLDRVFGLDRLLRLHAKVGTVAVLLAILHPMLLYGSGSYELPVLAYDRWPEILGAVLLVVLCVIAGTSLGRLFLDLSYEGWRAIHQLVFVAVVMATVHATVLGSDLAVGWARHFWHAVVVLYAVMFVWVKVVKPIVLSRRRFVVSAVTQISHNVVNLDLIPPEGFDFDHLPGQFAFLKLRRQGMKDEEHPFTISSAPTSGRSISFTIKSSGDFTSTIGETRAGDTATVDGPYGRFSHLLVDSGDLLLIAGGVGITPLLSMLRYMCEIGDQRSITLIWGNRTEADILFRYELSTIESRLPNLRIVYVLSQQSEWNGEKGRMDESMLDRILTDGDRGATVFLCGPPPMMVSVTASLRKLGFRRSRIHSERFSLS